MVRHPWEPGAALLGSGRPETTTGRPEAARRARPARSPGRGADQSLTGFELWQAVQFQYVPGAVDPAGEMGMRYVLPDGSNTITSRTPFGCIVLSTLVDV